MVSEIPGFRKIPIEEFRKSPHAYSSWQAESPLAPKKQNLTTEQLSMQNIRGYAGLAQEILDIYDLSEITPHRHRRRNLARTGSPTVDPLAKIGLEPEKVRDLVEGVEIMLSMLRPRLEQPLRLRFRLDESGGGLRMFDEIRVVMESLGYAITKHGAQSAVKYALRRLSTRRDVLRERLFGDTTGQS